MTGLSVATFCPVRPSCFHYYPWGALLLWKRSCWNRSLRRSLTLWIFPRIGRPPVSSQRLLGIPILSSAFSLQVFSLSIQMFISPACAGAGRMIDSPVGSHSFRSFSPSVAFRRCWSVSRMLGSAPWGTISVFGLFSSCCHNDFDGIHSLVPFLAAGALLSWLSPLPTSSGLMWSCWWSALMHVLQFCVLFRILCNLPYILRLRFPYLFLFFSYVLPCVFLSFLHQLYYGLQGTCSCDAFRQDETRGFLLACSSCLGIDTVVSMAWCLNALSLPYSSSIDIVWHSPVSLFLGSSSFLAPTLFLTAELPCVCLSSAMAVLYICLPPYLDWHFTGERFFPILDLWHLLPSLCSTGEYLYCYSVPLYVTTFIFLAHPAVHVNVGTSAKLSMQVTEYWKCYFWIKINFNLLTCILNSYPPTFPTFHVPCKLAWGFLGWRCGTPEWGSG